MMHLPHRLNQNGGASLLAVVFTSMLMMVLVVAMVSLMVGELRQSTDGESSIKSYYQAESAAEEASAYVSNRLANGSVTQRSDLNQDCLPPTPTQFQSSFLPTGIITCARVLVKGSLPRLQLKLNDPRQQVKEFDLTGLTFDTIDLVWDIDNSDDPARVGGDPLLAEPSRQ